MRRAGNGGSIINISSIYGLVGSDGGHPAYHASKAAVRNFSKAMAVRLGPERIRVNSVHPGFMPPMRSSTGMTPEARARLGRSLPLRRIGEVDEVAYGVLFLASDEASYVTVCGTRNRRRLWSRAELASHSVDIGAEADRMAGVHCSTHAIH